MSTTSQPDQVQETISDLAKAKPSQWVKCPICHDEWTRLRPCAVGKEWSYICVQCAETLVSWERIVFLYPMEKPMDNWPDDWLETKIFFPKDSPSYAMSGKERVPLTSNIRAYINAWNGSRSGEPALKWYLMHESMGVSLWKDKEFVTKYDNTLAAWHDIKNRLKDWIAGAEKSKVIEKESWSKGFQRPRY